jgi:hypothetical protein
MPLSYAVPTNPRADMPISRLAGIAVLAAAVLAPAGCGPSDTARVSGSGPEDVQGWRFASGKRPTRAEYAAVVAACQEGAVKDSRGKPLDLCLADLGLRRD